MAYHFCHNCSQVSTLLGNFKILDVNMEMAEPRIG